MRLMFYSYLEKGSADRRATQNHVFDPDIDQLDAYFDELAAMAAMGADSERCLAMAALMARAAEWSEAHGLNDVVEA